MACWVERGVRNHREVVIVCGRCGIGCWAIFLENTAPNAAPIKRARRGVLADSGWIGAMVIGGMTSQLRLAPQVIAANDSKAVGAVNRELELFRLRRGGC